MPADRTRWLSLALGLACAALVGYEILTLAAPSSEAVAHAEAWCHARGGTLTVVHVIGEPGLHCELPDGTLAHPPTDAATTD
jgi:putative hemolysin